MGDTPSLKWMFCLLGMAFLVAGVPSMLFRYNVVAATDLLWAGLIFWALTGLAYIAEHIYWR